MLSLVRRRPLDVQIAARRARRKQISDKYRQISLFDLTIDKKRPGRQTAIAARAPQNRSRKRQKGQFLHSSRIELSIYSNKSMHITSRTRDPRGKLHPRKKNPSKFCPRCLFVNFPSTTTFDLTRLEFPTDSTQLEFRPVITNG